MTIGAMHGREQARRVPAADGREKRPVTDVLWGVGAVSRRVGIAAATLRTWDRRYGLGPSIRTGGGHRRYSELDVARVARMSRLIDEGVPSAQAARVALGSAAGPGELPDGDAGRAGEGRAYAEDGAAAAVTAMVHAARELDGHTLTQLIAQVLERRGVVRGWTDVLAPFLVSVGTEWATGTLGIESEHVATECVADELRPWARQWAAVPARPRVLLASAGEEQHTLPLSVLAAALVERGVRSQLLGAGTPHPSLAAAVRKLRPAVVFLWSSRPETGRLHPPDTFAGTDALLLLGGPGWAAAGAQPPVGVRSEQVSDLGSAVARIGAVVD